MLNNDHTQSLKSEKEATLEVEFMWLTGEMTLKEALQDLLGCSSALLKKFYQSKELNHAVRPQVIYRLSLDLINNMKINPELKGPVPKLIGETHDYFVFHKPSRLHSHPLRYSDRDTLLNFLVQMNLWSALEVNATSYDRGLLYRLDFETSGLMILAKNESYFHHIRDHFKITMKSKFYLAIVEGKFNQEGVWSHFFASSHAKGSKQKVSLKPFPDGRPGALEVKLLLFDGQKSLLLINLEAGLRHQIRAQLAHLGFPILGDKLYGAVEAERLYLHAWRYEWEGEIQEDPEAELFDRFFDLNSAFKMGHDMLGTFKSR